MTAISIYDIAPGNEVDVWYNDPERLDDPPFYVNGILIGLSDEAVEGVYIVLSEEDTITDGMEVQTAIRAIPLAWLTQIQDLGVPA